MNQAQKIRRYSVNEYLLLERESDVRHEYLDGEIIAMGGASRIHNTLVTNLVAAIRPQLRDTSCRLGSGDMKVFIAAANRAYYPDLVVSCSKPDDELDAYTETHPRLIIEVLSPSTEATDRTEKRLNYQRLDSLQEYVLITQNEPLIEVYQRQPDGWISTRYGAGETVDLPSIELSLRVAVIYEDIPLVLGDS
jgi:Uma2 family endonuclease